MSVEQIKKLNEKGYVIGKYIYNTSGYYDLLGWINPLDKITHKNMKEYITKASKQNLLIRTHKDFKFCKNNESINLSLKHALIHYKLSNGSNEDMVKFLVDILVEKKEEIKLFIPNIVWMLLKCFPSSHKFIKAFVPDKKAYKDYVLFLADIPIKPYIGEKAYEFYAPL